MRNPEAPPAPQVWGEEQSRCYARFARRQGAEQNGCRRASSPQNWGVRGAFLLLLLLQPAHAAQGETPQTQARAAIQANYNAIDAAFEHRELDRAYTFFAPQYVSIDRSGKRTGKTEAREYNANLLKKVKTLKAQTQVTACVLSKGGAEVTTHQTAKITAEARILFVRKTVHVQTQSHTRDFWVQTPQGWRITESRILSDQSAVDGKPTRDIPQAR